MNRTRLAIAGQWRIGSDELELRRDSGGLQQLLPDTLGPGQSRIIQLDPDLSCIETWYTPSRHLAVFSRIESDESRMVVTLGLKGRSLFLGARGHELVFSEGYTTITTFASSVGERCYEADKRVAQLRFSIGRNWLARYFGEERTRPLFNGRAVHTVSHRPTSLEAIIAAEKLLHDPESTQVGRLRKHARALSILAVELNHLGSEQRRDDRTFGKKEMSQANLARDILRQEFREPPSVEELARRVGVNQFKLKQLFHHFFDSTPYGVLLDIRMNHAYRLMESTRCPVGVAADRVGYAHASNFSAAFAKYYGRPPKSLAKK